MRYPYVTTIVLDASRNELTDLAGINDNPHSSQIIFILDKEKMNDMTLNSF